MSYRQIDYSPEARGAKMLSDFRRYALQCSGIASHVDEQVPDRYRRDLQTEIDHLMSALRPQKKRINKIGSVCRDA